LNRGIFLRAARQRPRDHRVPRRLAILFGVTLLACDEDRPITAPPPPPPPPGGVAAVIVSPSSQGLVPGDSVRLSAEARDPQGDVLPNEPITWASADPNIATVDVNGVVHAVAEGDALITAEAGGVTGGASIQVADVVICECTVVFDSNQVRLMSVDSASGTYTFDVLAGDMPALDSADVLVGGQGEGFLRKVTSVSTSGRQLVVETEDAMLTDAVQSGAFGTSALIDLNDARGFRAPDGTVWGPTQVTYLAPGVTQERGVLIGLDGVEVSAQASATDTATGGTVTGTVKLTINDGDFEFGPSVDIGGRIGWNFIIPEVREFHAIFGGGVDLDIREYTISASVAAKIPAEKTLFKSIKPFATAIGPVPIVGAVETSLKLVVSFEVEAAADPLFVGHFGAGFGVSGGARYQGSWSPVYSANSRFDAGIEFDPDVNLKATVKLALVPELFIRFYGVVGPFTAFEPYARAFAELRPIPWDWRTAMDLGLDFKLGFKIDILGLVGAELALQIPLVNPLLLAEEYSKGPLVVTNVTTGSDRPPSYPLLLRPDFEIKDPIIARKNRESNQDVTLALDGRHVFQDIRTGESFPHATELGAIQGNCTPTSPVRVVVDVASDGRINLFDADSTRANFDIFCIPFGAVLGSVVTTGANLDPDGYTLVFVRTDETGTTPKWFADNAQRPDTARVPVPTANAQVLLDSLIPLNPKPGNGASGTHTLALTGVRRNCAAARPVTHQTTALSGDTVSVTIQVVCIPLGFARAASATTDPDAAPPSAPVTYDVALVEAQTGAATTFTLGAVDETVVGDLIPLYNASGADGVHALGIGNAPNRCRVVTAAAPLVTVLSADTTEAAFEVACVERLQVKAVTTGAGAVPGGGFGVTVETVGDPADAHQAAIGTVDSVGVVGVTPGRQLVTLTGVPASCVARSTGRRMDGTFPMAVSGTDTITIDVDDRDSTLARFDVDCPPPDAPQNFTATAVSPFDVDLAWAAPSDPLGVIRHYRLYRDAVLFDSTEAGTTTFQDAGLPAFSEFVYQVAAVNVDDVESGRATAGVRTLDATPPTAPGDLNALGVSESRIDLTWTAAADPETGIEGYVIHRDGAEIAAVGPGATGFSDTGLPDGTAFSYTVFAVNGQGLQGPAAGPATAATLALGDLTVSTATTGADLDPDGYTVTVDGTAGQEIGVNGTVTFADLLEGDHTVELTGVAANCTVAEENPRTVTVPPNGAVETAFAVDCAATTGSLDVSAATTGQNVDGDGYTVTVDGVLNQALDVNGTVTFPGLLAGDHEVALSGVADNCAVVGQNPRTASVPAGGSAATTFRVECAAPTTGTLVVATETSGGDVPDGYQLEVSSGGDLLTQPIGQNDVATFPDLAPAVYNVVLKNAPEGCTVTAPNPRTATVAAGAVTITTFVVSCADE
jgi:hypothetical protein